MSQRLRIIWRIDKRKPLTIAYRQGLIFILNENQNQTSSNLQRFGEPLEVGARANIVRIDMM